LEAFRSDRCGVRRGETARLRRPSKPKVAGSRPVVRFPVCRGFPRPRRVRRIDRLGASTA